MELAISRHSKGKPPVETLAKYEYLSSFKNERLDIKDLQKIIQDGYAFCSALTRPYRSRKNFKSAPVISLDFDTEDYSSSFDGLLEHEFIANYASFFYTTPSHTPEKPRARVVFELSTPIFDMNVFQVVTSAMLDKYFPLADQACKDAARIFFGSPGCEVLHLGNKKIPTKKFIYKIVKPYVVDKVKQREASKDNFVYNGSGDYVLKKRIEKVLRQVSNAPEGERNNELNKASFVLGGLVAAGYNLTTMEAIDLLHETATNASNPLPENEISYTIQKGIRTGQLTPILLKDPHKQIASIFGK